MTYSSSLLYRKGIISLLFLIYFGMLYSQNDNLFNKSFPELEEVLKNNKTAKPLAVRYAEAYLQKAKKTNDTIKIVNGYTFFTEIYISPLVREGVDYCDSIIQLTKNLKDNDKFLAIGFRQKGRYYYRYGEYKLALDNYIMAMEHSKDDPMKYETTNFDIGLIKNNINEREEARPIFKRYINFLESYHENKPIKKNLALFALADNYNYTNELDSAALLIDKGIKSSLAINDNHTYKYFVISSGINSVFKEQYSMARDSLLKSDSLLVANYDLTSRAIGRFYLGKTYLALNDQKKALYYLKSVDSILQETNDVTPELLEAYNILINHYKTKKDSENHIYYITALLKFDSILNTNYRYVAKKMIKNYDVKNLIAEKNREIVKLNEEKSDSKNTILILFSCLIFLSLLIYYFIRKNNIQKKRFRKLLDDYQNKREVKIIKIEKEEVKENARELPVEIVNRILLKLNKFESSNEFIKKKYTLQTLAKEFNTNSKYLSKVINEYKQVNFSSYLNNLRIDFIINELTINKRFRKFTIDAIAEESGFKTRKSFSTAFYKKTGIRPSYFIKQLKNETYSS